jgi:hypothetical protein
MYRRTAAPVRPIRAARAAQCRTACAASTRSTPPAVPPRCAVLATLAYRRVPYGWALARAVRGVWYAGHWQRRARGYLLRLRQCERRRLDPHEHNGACALLEYPVSTGAPRLPSGCSAPHRTRHAVPHGECCEYPESPNRRYRLGARYWQRTGVPPGTFWVGAGASCARRVVCRLIPVGS